MGGRRVGAGRVLRCDVEWWESSGSGALGALRGRGRGWVGAGQGGIGVWVGGATQETVVWCGYCGAWLMDARCDGRLRAGL